MRVKIAQIGNGKAAKFHRQNYPENTQLVALVVRDLAKNLKSAKGDPTLPKDIYITDNLQLVTVKFKNLIWDVVSDDETHFDYVTKLIDLDKEAKIILAKTPYEKMLINNYREILAQHPKVKISVTENYAVSNVSLKIGGLIKKYNLKPKLVILEFTKNRIKDIEEGRFIHPSLGALGYEGSHILTVLETLGLFLGKVKSAVFEDLVLSNGRIFKNQGSCLIEGTTDGARLVIYTSMNGKVKYQFPMLGIDSDIGYGAETRFRVVVIQEGELKIIGQYDPVPGKKRFFGRILVLKDDKMIEKIDDIYDNTIKKILAEQICYLAEQGCQNPMAIEATEKFTVLEEIYQKFSN